MDSDGTETSQTKDSDKKRNIFDRFYGAVRSDLDFIPYKLLYASIYGAGGCLIPYLPLYYKQLGFSAIETGVLVSLRPLCLALISPIWGFLADRYKKRRLILFIGALAWILKTMLILAVQPRRQQCLVIHANNSLSKATLEERVLRGRRSMLDSKILNRVFNWKIFIIKPKTNYKWQEGKKQLAIPYSRFNGIKMAETHVPEENEKSYNISGGVFQRGLDIKQESKPSWLGHEASDQFSIDFDKTEMVIIFYILLVLTLFGEIFSAMLHPIADGCLVDCLGEQRSLYGRVRLWSSLATSLGTLVIGILINQSTYYYCGEARKNYNIAFYFFAAFMTLGFASIFCIKIVYCSQSENKASLREVKRLFNSLPKTAFWIASIILGMLDGFQTEFTTWFLDDLGASSVIVGLAAGLHYGFNMVVFFVANYVLDFLGYSRAIILCLAVYTVIFACLSVIQAPWLGLILHALAGSCFAVSWTASVAYVGSESSSAGLGATAQGNTIRSDHTKSINL